MSLILDGTNGLSDVDGTAATPAIRGTDTNTGIFFPAADTIAFTEGGVEIARFDSSGTFIVGPFGGNGNAVVAGSSSPSFTNQPGTNLILKSGDGSGTGSSFMSFSTSPAGSSGTTVNTAAERMRIDSSGNVGIGTNNPGVKLDVVGGTIRSSISGGTPIFYLNNGTTQHSIQNNSGSLGFYNDGTERMRIDSSGNLLVGTTTANPGNGNNTIGTSVQGATGFYGCREPANYCVYLNSTALDGSNRANYISFGLYGTTNIGAIHANGLATVYATTSDYRQKEEILPITGALNKITQLKPCKWKWKGIDASSQGFIAHELQEIVPECVSGKKDAVDKDGKPVYQGIDTSFLVATLTAAIQELKAELDSVKAELQTLKGN